MIAKIKNTIIKKLGGYTEFEYNKKNCTLVDAAIKTYYIDDDALNFEKEQLAYKIGKELLDNDLIQFEILKQRDSVSSRIYEIYAKIFISKKDSK